MYFKSACMVNPFTIESYSFLYQIYYFIKPASEQKSFYFLLFSFFILGVPFPKNFQQVCKKILSRLFRVFVHVYIHHFDSICSMGAEAHINTCYKHYYYFISEFNLIDHSELEPLVRHQMYECEVRMHMKKNQMEAL